jgi:heme-degrading monooxygenase HmoA
MPLLAHNVYFALNDPSAAAVEELVESCKKYLSRHPGVVFFAAGALCRELERPVNDRDFDVALHVVFEDKAAHDAYQAAPEHHEFIAKHKAGWRKVRVFDSYVEQVYA